MTAAHLNARLVRNHGSPVLLPQAAFFMFYVSFLCSAIARAESKAALGSAHDVFAWTCRFLLIATLYKLPSANLCCRSNPSVRASGVHRVPPPKLSVPGKGIQGFCLDATRRLLIRCIDCLVTSDVHSRCLTLHVRRIPRNDDRNCPRREASHLD